MDLNEIERNAKALMTHHGVGYMSFKWGNSKRRIAACFYYKVKDEHGRTVAVPHEIQFSKNWAPLLTPEQIHETMLHEIAHAKAPGDGHGARWAAECRKLGIKPERCKSGLDEKPAHSVEGICPECDKVVAQQHRLPLRVAWCRDCLKAGRAVLGDRSSALLWFKNGERMMVSMMPARYRAEFHRRK